MGMPCVAGGKPLNPVPYHYYHMNMKIGMLNLTVRIVLPMCIKRVYSVCWLIFLSSFQLKD